MRGDNIFFVDPSVIISRLKNTQKAIKIIDIRKKIPNTIEISLESYAPLFRI
jgi:cell division septal protein FtsQ